MLNLLIRQDVYDWNNKWRLKQQNTLNVFYFFMTGEILINIVENNLHCRKDIHLQIKTNQAR